MIDLSICEPGDKLISKHGAVLEYVSPTPYQHVTYLDHVVRYVTDKYGNKCKPDNLGSRTNDGYTFLKKRLETDDDIVEIIKPIEEKFKLLCSY